MMASVLSINYQGGFSIEYEEMQEILKMMIIIRVQKFL